MDRRFWMLKGLDVERLQGIEIGPLTNPVVPRCDGKIIYVDRANTETLRHNYKDHHLVEPSHIVEIDAVWEGNSLQQAIGEAIQVDYVLAAHVIEHVPDFLGWISEIHQVLRPEGELRLIVPDRRFTFDRLRQETRFSDIVYAYLVKARAPLPPMLLDHLLEVARIDPVAAWSGTVDDSSIERMHDFSLAQSVALDALQNGTYHDVHCWTFTPFSFVNLMARAAALGLIGFECNVFRETEVNEIEFFVGLRRSEVQSDVVSSWQRAAEKLVNSSAPILPSSLDGSSLEFSLAASLAQISIELDKAVARLSMIDAATVSNVMSSVRAAAVALAEFAELGSGGLMTGHKFLARRSNH